MRLAWQKVALIIALGCSATNAQNATATQEDSSTATTSRLATSSAAEVLTKATSIARTDFKAGLTFLEANSPQSEQPVARFRLVLSLCQDDLRFVRYIPEKLPAVAQSGFPAVDADAALNGVCAFWLSKDKDKIVSFVRDLDAGPLREKMTCYLAEGLVTQSDFQSATALLGTIPTSSIPTDTFVTVAIRYNGKDTEELYKWASDLPSRAQLRVIVSLAQSAGAKKNLAELVKILPHASGLSRPPVLAALGVTAGKVKSAGAVDWLRSLSLEPDDTAATLAAAMRTVPEDKLENLLESGLAARELSVRRAATSAYINRVFANNRDLAIKWTVNSPSEIRSAAIGHLVGTWYRSGGSGLFDWIHGLKHGQDRDVALKTYVDMLWKADPDLARSQASEIEDPSLRREALSQFGKHDR